MRSFLLMLVIFSTLTAVLPAEGLFPAAGSVSFSVVNSYTSIHSYYTGSGKNIVVPEGFGGSRFLGLGGTLKMGILPFLGFSAEWDEGWNWFSHRSFSIKYPGTSVVTDEFYDGQVFVYYRPVRTPAVEFQAGLGVNIPVRVPDFSREFDKLVAGDSFYLDTLDYHDWGFGLKTEVLFHDFNFFSFYGGLTAMYFPFAVPEQNLGLENYIAVALYGFSPETFHRDFYTELNLRLMYESSVDYAVFKMGVPLSVHYFSPQRTDEPLDVRYGSLEFISGAVFSCEFTSLPVPLLIRIVQKIPFAGIRIEKPENRISLEIESTIPLYSIK